MKAIILEQFGGPEVLKQAALPDPVPAPQEILIRNEFASVNPVDWKIRKGLLQERLPHHFPIIPGWDAAGTVAAIGSDVTHFKPGDRVFAYCRKDSVQWGTYAEYVTVHEMAAAIMPVSLDFAAASTIPLACLTAWQCLFEAGSLQKGQSILIHAAAGGVGGFAVQLAKCHGAKIYATASKANHDYVKSLGADHVIDYQAGNFAEEIKRLEPDGIDMVFDTVGGDTQRRSYDVLKHNGMLVSILAFEDETLAQSRNVQQAYVFVQPSGAQLRKIAALVDEGIIRPPPYEIMNLDQAAEAQAKNETRHGRGKIVLKIR